MGIKIKIFLICILLISSTISFFSYNAKTEYAPDNYFLNENNSFKNIPQATGNTYYVSTKGSDNNPGTQIKPFKTIQKAMNIVNPGDIVYVRGGTYHAQCTMTRSGTSEAWITFINYPNETPIIDGSGIYPPDWGGGTIHFSSVSYVVLDGFQVKNSIHSGICTRLCNFIIIQNCYTYNTGYSGIRADNGVEIDPQPPSSYIYVYKNIIEKPNRIASQEALTFSGIHRFSIKYNKVFDTSKEGIACKDGCAYGEIAYNDISSRGPDIYIDSHYYFSHNFKIFSNYCYGSGNGMSIGMEQNRYSENYSIYNNIFANDDHGFQDIMDLPPYNNYVNNISFICNTFDCGNSCIKINPLGGYEFSWTNITIKNNIFKSGRKSIYKGPYQDSDDIDINYNLFATKSSDLYGTYYLIGDPKWVNPSSGDYHLQSNSPAIDAFDNYVNLNIDYDGTTRPQGDFVDLGAFEYKSGTTLNNPPSKPIINGEPNGNLDIEYLYSFISTDPENDEISYYVDWDDNSPASWTRTLPSGTYFNSSHSWDTKGSYTIKAKAKDKYDAESEWATFVVTMPKTSSYNQQNLLLRITQLFPILEKIIKLIL